MGPVRVQEADRAEAARGSIWWIGQARGRTLSASSTGPSGCLSAGISGLAERATQAPWSVRNAGSLLWRCADWVRPVRERASAAVRARLNIGHAATFAAAAA